MVTIKITTNTDRKQVIVPETITPKQILLDNEIDFSTAVVNLDGAALSVNEMNATLAELNVSGTAYMAVVVKLTNG